VIDPQLRRQLHRLGEVDQPNTGVGLIVDEEQGAADDLVGLEELRYRQSGPYRTQTLDVSGLYKKETLKFSCFVIFISFSTHQNVGMAAEELDKGQLDLFA